MNQAIERDAHEYGLHVRGGDWRLALLVARNVVKGTRGGDTTGPKRNAEGKVSATTFAELSNTSVPRILRHLTTWDKAAEAGHVPPSNTLSPGDEIDLDVEALPDWGEFYPGKPYNHGVPTASPESVAASIRRDPAAAEAAAETLSEREVVERMAPSARRAVGVASAAVAKNVEGKARTTTPEAQALSDEAEAVVLLNEARIRIARALSLAAGVDLNESGREKLLDRAERVETTLGWIISYLRSGSQSWETELAQLLGEES